MENNFKIELIPEDQLSTILPLVYLLNESKISEKELALLLKEMIAMNYQCIGVYDAGKLIGICGIWILKKFYIGKHIEPDNVYILPAYRSKGVGKLMIDWVNNYAKEIGCNSTEINCYVKNVKGKQFWENQGYIPEGYHMRKVFKNE